MKRAAVIGLGTIAQVHVPILRQMEEVQLCAVCDIDPARAALAPEAAFYTDYKRLIETEKPDAVHLCLPHWLHYPMAKYAVEAGVNVFCEKPLALNAAEAAEFAALEAAHPEVKITLCLQNRFNESTEMLRGIIESGLEGQVRAVKGVVAWQRPKEYYEQEPWRGRMAEAGGGVMINQSIHTLDLMQLLGGPIASIRGGICQLLDYGIEVEDTATAHIQYANGAAGLFYATIANSRNDSVDIVVDLEKNSYAVQQNKLWRLGPDGSRTLLAEDGRLPGTKFYYGASHAKLIRLFYQELEEGGARCPKAAEGVVSMRMIDAIRRSSALGEAVAL